MNELYEQQTPDHLDALGDLDEINPYLAQITRKLRDVKLSYHILHLSPDEVEDIYEIRIFEDPVEALDFYISLPEDLTPRLKCLITGNLGHFGYSCIAPLKLASLVDIADSVGGGGPGQLPAPVKELATKALAKRIHYDLPFNSENHGYVI